ncbi:tRNA lysidine(34) synthetase TilS [Lactobacillus agrestimuris]|uniref:tRNA lysidine(34) synthetase TilS n=1 Tax=Lactobacillus agrestimuris TaxID=2941328 RepID=UPI002043AC77|nr:tRNA lysidine(34) synthetase TilS [Lactobacillus agrestimuris]
MNQIIEFFQENKVGLKNKCLVIATSGGPDSMALVDMLTKLKDKYNLRLIVAHFDHQLRPDSKQETILLEKYCHKNHLEFRNKIWVRDHKLLSGIEAAAREKRYRFLVDLVNELSADYLLTAHHGDDLVENILLKLIRSGNPNEMNSLQAISKREGILLLRPLLSFSKNDLLLYVQANHLDYIEDATNAEDDVMRNRLRHHVVPLLKKENPDLIKNALRFNHEMNQYVVVSEEWFEDLEQPEEIFDQVYRIKSDELKKLNSEKQAFYWQHFIWNKWHLRVNDELNGFTLQQYQGYDYVWRDKDLLTKDFVSKFDLQLDRPFEFLGRKFLLTENAAYPAEKIGKFKASTINFSAGSLSLGTRLNLKDGHHAKSKKFFSAAAIPSILRKYCLTIFNNDQPVFVENTYQNQVIAGKQKEFFVYRLKNI